VESGGPIFFGAICLALFSRVDLFALTALGLPTGEAGYYGAAQNLAVVPGLFAASFTPVFLSAVNSLQRSGDHERARILMRDAMRIVCAMLPFAALAAGAAREIVTLIFGATFSPAGPILARMIFGKVAALMISVAIVIMIVANRPWFGFALAGSMLALAIAAHIVVIPILGSLRCGRRHEHPRDRGALVALIIVYRLQRVSVPLATTGRTLLIASAVWLCALLQPAHGFWVVGKVALISLGILAGNGVLGELRARPLPSGDAPGSDC
jgi:hypothetical protein